MIIATLALMLNYYQLERLWVRAGGPPGLAPTMAAVAIAETHPIGDAHHARMALANYDRHELGGSFCGWQIQRAHTEGYAVGERAWSRKRLLTDPLYCARAAVYVARIQGLDAWTTHQDGEFLSFIERDPPSARKPSPEITPIPERHPNLARMLRQARQRQAFVIRHPKRYTQFIPPQENEKPSPAETVTLGFVAVGLVCYTRRSIRQAIEADRALKKRTRRRAPNTYIPRHRKGVANA